MKNLKHSIVAMIAVAMISSLAAVQAATINGDKNIATAKIAAADVKADLTIAKATTITQTGLALKDEADVETTKYDRSAYETGFVMITDGVLNVKELPSDDANNVGELNACDQVEVLEFSEGWYKIHSGDVIGYVPSSTITIEKSQADYAKMHFDNYKKAVVTTNEPVRVREKPSTDSNIIDEFEPGTGVILLWSENDFIRVAYGTDYDEGYIINTALTITGEWIPKSEVSSRQETVAKERAAQRAAEEAAARAREAANRYKSYSGSYNTSGSGAPATSSKGQAIVNTAMNYLGVPYVWGGTSPSGFDCSGLVQYVCRKNGINIARVAASQRNCGTYVSRNNLQPGDLVFFGKGISHVGIYIGNGNMIHAPQTGDVVKISSINTNYRISQYAGAVRVY